MYGRLLHSLGLGDKRDVLGLKNLGVGLQGSKSILPLPTAYLFFLILLIFHFFSDYHYLKKFLSMLNDLFICGSYIEFYFSPVVSLSKVTRLQVHQVENPWNRTLSPAGSVGDTGGILSLSTWEGRGEHALWWSLISFSPCDSSVRSSSITL